MSSPTKLFTVLLLLSSFLAPEGRSQALTLLGTPDFDIDGGVSLAPYTQGSTSFTINGTPNAGDGVGGGFLDSATGLPTSYDWTGVTTFGLVMSLASPVSAAFTVDFFDASGLVGTFTGDTSTLTTDFTELTLTEDFRSDLSAVIGMQFTIDDSVTISNLTVTEVVPEPSTWALLLLGTVVLGLRLWRRGAFAFRR